MSYQRRRGQSARIWRTVTTSDRRGNTVKTATEDGPHEVRAAFIPQRSARAEVPGQQDITIYRMLVDPSLTDVDLWSRVEWMGYEWDVVAPPVYHHGSRHTRHWSLDIRRRPSG